MCVSSVLRKIMMNIMRTCMVLNLMVAWSSALAEELWCTTAFTMEKDSAKAGQELAKKAKESCKERVPKLVLVFGNDGKTMEERTQFMAALGEQFDKKLIYGCGYRGAAINQETNEATASIAVLGGDLKVTARKLFLDKEQSKEAPRYLTTLAEEFKPAYVEGQGKGRLLIVLGRVSPWPPLEVFKPFRAILGNDLQAFGGCTTPNEFQYFQGEPLQLNAVVLLVTGDFNCGFGMEASKEVKEKKPQQPESVEESAKQAVARAIDEKKDDVACLLVCSCCTRYYVLNKAKLLPLELKALTDATAAPIIGFYGEGEIGQEAADKPAVTLHQSLSICALRKIRELEKKNNEK